MAAPSSHDWRIWALVLTAPAMCGGCAPMLAAGKNADGVRMHQQGFYQGAVERFQQAIAADPNNADSFYNLAATYHQLGKQQNNDAFLQQAETYYTQCLDRNPNHRDCYRGYAVLLVERERSDEAFRLVEGWSQRNPILADPKIELARLWEEFGDREAAKKNLQEALAIEPTSSRALTALGHIQEELGEKQQALLNYQRALQQDRWQPELQARVASLQTAFSPAPLTAGFVQPGSTTSADATRTAVRPGASLSN